MAKTISTEPKLPSPHDWRTTDTDEINRRRQRAREESFTIANTDPRHPIFSNFRVASRSKWPLVRLIRCSRNRGTRRCCWQSRATC